ncbi:methyltransferase [Streptomyces sp. BHT-5-2]|uniref:methyltransferase n=1 Tax=Streptomyces sp. BHT-5-2 TaxID=2866715 RepID=UPI001C8D9A49|nr:methyltransferase [Streptomyces sp. BHT-5-2]QZL06415.1 methyltransferase [Streptomyces sp. BHT-5-2]
MSTSSASTATVGKDPLPVLELAMAFYGSRALMSALELGVFTALAEGAVDRTVLEEKLGLHSRTSRDFLDSLVALGLLTREGGEYANSALAQRFLVRGTDPYVGGFAEMGSASLYPLWGKLTDTLRTGDPQIPEDSNFFEGLYRRPDAARKFMDAMDAFNADIAATLDELADWESYATLTDVGGARGDLAARLVTAYPQLSAVCMDLPGVRALFDERVREAGVADRVTFHSADFVSDALPASDAYIFGHILHGRDLDQRRDLVARAYAGLNPGGSLFIYDRMIDDNRDTKVLSLLGSLGMALVSRIGSEYTPSDCRSWLEEAGFQVVDVRPLAVTDTIIVARKPS